MTAITRGSGARTSARHPIIPLCPPRREDHKLLGWVGEDGSFACYGWASGRLLSRVTSNAAVTVPWEAAMDLELLDEEVYLWDFFTPASRRRRNHYTSFLLAIRQWCHARGASMVTIYCRGSNVASIRGIVAAGFEPLGEMTLLRIGALRILRSAKLGTRVLTSPMTIRWNAMLDLPTLRPQAPV